MLEEAFLVCILLEEWPSSGQSNNSSLMEIAMTRRDPNSQSGWVNFPANNPQWDMTGEGGMFVTLLVYEEDRNLRDDRAGFFKCCGGASIVLRECEVLVAIVDCATGEHKTQEEREKFYGGVDVSKSLLAAVTMGTTGGSWGRSVEGEQMWENWGCGMGDLSEEGKNLVELLQKLYPRAHVELLTHLDT
jgi:hypothetical protein